MDRSKLAGLILLASVAPAAAQACTLHLEAPSSARWRGELSRGYDPFAATRHMEPLALEVRHRGTGCDYTVTFAAEGEPAALRLGGATLLYQALRGPSAARSLLEGNPLDPDSGAIDGRFPHQNEGDRPNLEQHLIYLLVPPGQITRGGQYGGRLTVRLFERKRNGQTVLKDQRAIHLSASVVPRLDAVIGDGGFDNGRNAARLHLGKLKAGSHGSLPFRVRSNMRYGISLGSANGGQLRHDKTDFAVPYQVRVNNRPVSIRGAGLEGLEALGGPTDANGDAYRLEVEVPEAPRRLLAGTYRDTLTVTFTTME